MKLSPYFLAFILTLASVLLMAALFWLIATQPVGHGHVADSGLRELDCPESVSTWDCMTFAYLEAE